MIMTDQQIEKHVIALIRNKYSSDQEAKYSRILHGQNIGTYSLTQRDRSEIAEYQSYIEKCRDTGKDMQAQAIIDRKQLAYDTAVVRLEHYKLEYGRPEFTGIDKSGGEYTIHAVEPVKPLMITSDVYDDTGKPTGTVEHLNPIIQKDRDERAAAQLIVDAWSVK